MQIGENIYIFRHIEIFILQNNISWRQNNKCNASNLFGTEEPNPWNGNTEKLHSHYAPYKGNSLLEVILHSKDTIF